VQIHGAALGSNIPISNVYDFDRNGKVDTTDIGYSQTHGTNAATGLKLIVVGPSGPFNPEVLPSAGPSASDDDQGIASALSIAPTASSMPTIPGPIANRLSQLELHPGPIAKLAEHLLQEAPAKVKSILAHAADALGIDEDLLDSLVSALKAAKRQQ